MNNTYIKYVILFLFCIYHLILVIKLILLLSSDYKINRIKNHDLIIRFYQY